MKRLVLLASLFTLCARSSAQGNLVQNGSFENFITCPVSAGQGNWATGWVVPNQGSPDFYHYCSQSEHLEPPDIVYGYEYPNTGQGFIGMYFFVLIQPEGREYIQVQLAEPLEGGVRYKVSFYVSLAELSLYAVSSIGAYLSSDVIQGNEFDVLEVEPQIQNPAGNIIADTSGWVLVTDTFVSRQGGGEEWLTIGNFNHAAESDTLAFQPPNPDMGNFFFSYYYIDDVSVIALDSVPNGISPPAPQRVELELYPNPATDVLHVQAQSPMERLRLYEVSGRAVLRRDISGRVYELDLSGLPSGMYFLEVTDREGRRATKRIVKTDGQ